MKGTIRIGTGGWVYEPWRGSFYPKGLPRNRELAHASRVLTSIEINSTYYGLKRPENFAAWRDETPEGFVFALKAPRSATHHRALAEAGGHVEAFLRSGVTRLGEKLGPINWQFPPFKRFDPADFEGFLRLLPASHDGVALRHAVEVRHESFLAPGFVSLARRYGVAVVLAVDSPYPRIDEPTAPFVYARLMGTREEEESGYPGEELDLWAARMDAWASGGPSGLRGTERTAGLEGEPGQDAAQAGRDVFLYVIAGAKERNPRACMALIERVRGGASSHARKQAG